MPCSGLCDWGGASQAGWPLLHGVSAGAAQLGLEDPRPRQHSSVAGKLVLAGQGVQQGLKIGLPRFLSTSCLDFLTAWWLYFKSKYQKSPLI